MFKLRKYIFLTAIVFLLAAPFATKAFAPLVPCSTDITGQRACTLCDLIVGIKGIIDFGMTLIAVAAIAGITFAGIMYVVAAGDQKMMESAKSFLGACLKGFAFFFLAWLMITVTMWILGAKTSTDDGGVLGIGVTGWNTFTCDSVSSQGQGSNPNPGNPNKYSCDKVDANANGTIEANEIKCNANPSGTYPTLSDCDAGCGTLPPSNCGANAAGLCVNALSCPATTAPYPGTCPYQTQRCCKSSL